MKITTTILSIPPYLSTSWDQIVSIHTETIDASLVLIVSLRDGTKKEVPGLDGKTIEQIFEAHAQFLDLPQDFADLPPFSFSLQKEGDAATLPSFGDSLQHNGNQAKIPNLPRHILLKIAQIAKIFGLEDASFLPDAETDCNCVHCQLIRVIKEEEAALEENIADEDLHFENWKIEQTGDHLYQVTNPLDTEERYQVFLGTPVGCSCNQAHCEHIQAVLRS